MRSAWLVVVAAAVTACGGDDGGKRPVNDPCETNSDCADNICHLGFCASASPRDNGQPCGGPGDCKSATCSGGKCVAGYGSEGRACRYPDECASKSCVSGKCAGSKPSEAGAADGSPPDGGASVDAPSDAAARDGAVRDGAARDAAVRDGARRDASADRGTGGDARPPDAPMPDLTPDTGPCSSSSDCDDKLICTIDSCGDGSACTHRLLASWCLIGGKCYGSGQLDPNNSCRRCQPTSSTSGWTAIIGKTCDDSQSCTYGDICRANGRCLGTPYYCDDGLSCTVDTCTGTGPASSGDGGIGDGGIGDGGIGDGGNGDGGASVASGGCTFKLKTGSCLIGGKCYAGGATDSTDSTNCRTCDASLSTKQWSPGKGCVITLAGSGSAGFVNGPALTAQFNAPDSLAVDRFDRVYVVQRKSSAVRVVADGKVKNLYKPDSFSPAAIEVDSGGNVYISGSQRGASCAPPWKISAVWSGGSTRKLVAGVAYSGCAGYNDGAAGQARFNQIWGLGADKSTGKIYIGDGDNHRVRWLGQVSGSWRVGTYAGSGANGSKDGPLLTAQFTYPRGIAVDGKKMYVAGWNSHKIRLITGGQVTTLAGGSGPGFKDGAASVSLFNYPADVAVYKGAIYVADAKNHRIRVIEPASSGGDGGVSLDGGAASDGGTAGAWRVRTIAGTGVAGFKDGAALSAQFYEPRGVDVGPSGLIYVVDKLNHRIRVIRP